MRKLSRIFIVVIFLIGCATPNTTRNFYEKPPENYIELVQKHINTHFFDPYSVRDLVIKEPQRDRLWKGLVFGGYEDAWKVEVTCNAKNKFGGYIGLHTQYYWIKNNEIIKVTND